MRGLHGAQAARELQYRGGAFVRPRVALGHRSAPGRQPSRPAHPQQAGPRAVARVVDPRAAALRRIEEPLEPVRLLRLARGYGVAAAKDVLPRCSYRAVGHQLRAGFERGLPQRRPVDQRRNPSRLRCLDHPVRVSQRTCHRLLNQNRQPARRAGVHDVRVLGVGQGGRHHVQLLRLEHGVPGFVNRGDAPGIAGQRPCAGERVRRRHHLGVLKLTPLPDQCGRVAVTDSGDSYTQALRHGP